MMKKIISILLNARCFCGVFALFFMVCTFLTFCSTGETSAGKAMDFIKGSSEALIFLDCKSVSGTEIEFTFSKAVTVKSLNFEPELAVSSITDRNAQLGDEQPDNTQGSVIINLESAPSPGVEITANILAEDSGGNTLNVLVNFRSRNDRMPQLVINEICTEYSKPKSEFIEFKIIEAGNLGGMRIFIEGNSAAASQTIYEFMPQEVKAGEYLTLHLRTIEEGCTDEYGEDLTASGGANSSPDARDFWMPDSAKLVHKAASAVYVLDQDERALDAIMISETASSSWGKDYFAKTAGFLFEQGAWKSADENVCSPADSVISAGSTGTRTICRDETAEDSGTAADWYITATGSATPGKPNNPKRYEPK